MTVSVRFCYAWGLIKFFGPGNGSPIATNVVLLLLVLVMSTKAFYFTTRSSLSIAYRLKTIFSTIAPCWIFKLSRN